MKTLKRIIKAISYAGTCVLAENQIRRKIDFKQVVKVRKDTLTRMINEGYINVDWCGVIHLSGDAVVMLPWKDQLRLINADEPLRDALTMLPVKDRVRWMKKHYIGS